MKCRVACGAGAIAAFVLFTAGGGCGRGTLTGAGSGGRGTVSGRGGAVSTGTGGAGATQTGTAGSWSECRSTTIPTALVPPAVLVLLDTSISMNETIDGPCDSDCAAHSKWAAAVAAIGAAAEWTDPAAHWGLSFLASPVDLCAAGGIAAQVPSSGSTIRLELARHSNGSLLIGTGGTPTRAAVDLAATYLSGRPDVGPDRIILLITDGSPDCIAGGSSSGLDNTEGAAFAMTNAFHAGITTAVVGLAITDSLVDFKLSYLAQAGGLARAGAPAYYPAASSAEIVEAILGIVTRVAGCTYAIPPASPQDVAATRENIRVIADGSTIPQDAVNGWTYADVTHTSVVLHGSACDDVSDGAPHEILIDYLCLIR